MTTYSGPDSRLLRRRLANLVTQGLEPAWILEVGGELLAMSIVKKRLPTPDSHEVDRYDDLEDANKDPRAAAVTDVIEEAIGRIGSRQYRVLLRTVLGLSPETQYLSLQERRTQAGLRFRSGGRTVSWGTIRTHHEPKALEQLTRVLVAMEAEERDETLP